jgi:hypothetical protein
MADLMALAEEFAKEAAIPNQKKPMHPPATQKRPIHAPATQKRQMHPPATQKRPMHKSDTNAAAPFSPDDVPGKLADQYGQEQYEIAQQARSAVFRVFRDNDVQPLDDTKFLLEAILKAGWGKP